MLRRVLGFRPLWGLVLIGMLGGVFLGVGAARDIVPEAETTEAPRRSANVDQQPTPESDVLGRQFGYEIAAAAGYDRVSQCAAIKPEFQRGCEAYVRGETLS